MKKLIFFANNLKIGGIETSIVNLLNYIDYNKYDVTLVLEEKEGVLLNDINSNVHIKEYKLSKSSIVLLRKMFNFIKRFVWTVFNRNKYDFSCCYATYSLMGAKLAKLASKNSSIYIHGDYTKIYKDSKELINFFASRKINGFRTVFFVSNESKDNLIKYYPSIKDKSVVINNFINYKKIIDLANENVELFKNHDILFVFIGRLEEKSKKVSRLLQLINILKNDYSIELWIIGDGQDRNSYKTYIDNNKLNDNIKILGSKKNPYPYMKQADYIILTSDYEGFPVIYLESIVLNKKIITTIDVSDESIIINNNYGYIISKDINLMKNEVEDILKHDSLVYKQINFDELNKDKMKKLEKIFDEVK